MLIYQSQLKPFIRQLRTNMTEAEIALWNRIRRKQIHNVQFYRQKPIGSFILDFYAKSIKLAIEVDGGQHFSASGLEKDNNRDAYLNTLGVLVLRFTNIDVLQSLDAVLNSINANVLKRLRASMHAR